MNWLPYCCLQKNARKPSTLFRLENYNREAEVQSRALKELDGQSQKKEDVNQAEV